MNSAIRIGVGASLVFAALSVCAPEAQAQVGGGRNFGLGLALGFPNVGLSGNYFMGQNSLQFAVAARYRNFSDTGALFLRADYLFYPATLARGSGADLKFYVGPGLNLGLGLGNVSGFYLGAELPVGLSVQLRRVPLDIAVEAVPVLFLFNGDGIDPAFGIGGTLHVRYYF